MQYTGGETYSKILQLNLSCHYSFTKKARHVTGTDGQPASLMISLSLFFPLQGSGSEASGDNSPRSKQNIKTREEDLFQAKSENTSLNVSSRGSLAHFCGLHVRRKPERKLLAGSEGVVRGRVVQMVQRQQHLLPWQPHFDK